MGVTVCSPDPLEPRPCCCWSQCDGTPAGHPGLSVQPAALGEGNSRRQAICECSCNKDPMLRDSELVLCQYGGSIELSSQAAQGLCSGGEARCTLPTGLYARSGCSAFRQEMCPKHDAVPTCP